MSDTVKVIWDGVNTIGISIRPREMIKFNPGINTISKKDWIHLTTAKRKNPNAGEPELFADDPGGLNFRLKGGKLHLASPDVQDVDDYRDISDMEWRGALQMIDEATTKEDVLRMEVSEKGREKARKSVDAALTEKLALFQKLDDAQAENLPTDEI